MSELEATITITDLPVVVTGTYVPAHCGARDSLGGIRGAGPPLEPDEPACIEDLRVVAYIDGAVTDVTELVDADTLAELEGEMIAAEVDRLETQREDYHRERLNA